MNTSNITANMMVVPLLVEFLNNIFSVYNHIGTLI